MDQPGFSRWQTWFEEAKKTEKTWLSRKQSRRQRRASLARQAGVEEDEIEQGVNSDSTDSAYISDDEDRLPVVEQASNKRKRGGNSNRWMASAKRSKPDHGRAGHSKIPYMSGALGFKCLSDIEATALCLPLPHDLAPTAMSLMTTTLMMRPRTSVTQRVRRQSSPSVLAQLRYGASIN